jgi:hypothetical protein
MRLLETDVMQTIILDGATRPQSRARFSPGAGMWSVRRGGALGELTSAVQAVRRIGGAVGGMVTHPAVGRILSMVSVIPSHPPTAAGSREDPLEAARAAIGRGDDKGLEESLERITAADVDMADRRGWTLLHHAAQEDRPAAAAALLRRGADRNAQTREARGLRGGLEAVSRALELAVCCVVGGAGLLAALACIAAGIYMESKLLLSIATGLGAAAAAAFLRPVLLTPRWRLVEDVRTEGARALAAGGVAALLLVLCSQYVAPFRSPVRVPPAAALLCAFYGLQRVRRPPRPRARDPMAGATALFISARCGSERVFELLLESGADPTIRTSAQRTVLDAINQCAPEGRSAAEVAAARRRMKGRLVAALWQQGLHGIAQMVSGVARVLATLVETAVEGALVAAALWW